MWSATHEKAYWYNRFSGESRWTAPTSESQSGSQKSRVHRLKKSGIRRIPEKDESMEDFIRVPSEGSEGAESSTSTGHTDHPSFRRAASSIVKTVMRVGSTTSTASFKRVLSNQVYNSMKNITSGTIYLVDTSVVGM